MVGRILGLCAGVLFAFGAGSAQAYCRTHTMDPTDSSCPDRCPEIGLPLAWRTPHLEYAFNVNGFPGIDDAALRSMIAQSLATWENVQCAGEPIGIDSSATPGTTTLALGPEKDDNVRGIKGEPNQNVIVHFDVGEWAEEELPSQAYAITAVWFRENGEIVGADMMFNGRMDPFGQCSDDGCTASDPRTDLRNVATHEFGHFLGLSHSAVEGSTMWCDADPQEVSKRSLAPDDIAGLCAIYPPGEAFPEARRADRCALAAYGEAPWGALAVPLALLWRRRRTRRKQA